MSLASLSPLPVLSMPPSYSSTLASSAVFSSPLGLSGYDGVTKLDDARLALALALALAPGVEASEDNKV